MKSCFFICTILATTRLYAAPLASCQEVVTDQRAARGFSIEDSPGHLEWRASENWNHPAPEIQFENQAFKLKFAPNVIMEIQKVNGLWVGVLVEPAPSNSPAAYWDVLFKCLVPEHGVSISNGG